MSDRTAGAESSDSKESRGKRCKNDEIITSPVEKLVAVGVGNCLRLIQQHRAI